ncbi:MAG: hypothetical protein GY786_05985 [Proteobacteria bacterium]|nr:hypothetical protein [Pseudomonadota bacterium]
MKDVLKYLLTLLIISAAAVGCLRQDNATGTRTIVVNANEDEGHSVAFKLNSSSRQLTSISKSQSELSASQGINFAASQIYQGQLSIKEGLTHVKGSPFFVSALIDSDTWDVELLQNFVLPAGIYTFELVLNYGNYQYVGPEFAFNVSGETNVPMPIYPVIGDFVLETGLVTQMASYKFQFQDVLNLYFSEPLLGVIIDAGNEDILDIDDQSGMTEVYVNLEAGNHTIELKLYDGKQQKGRSVLAQENQTITAGNAFSMDLVALYGINSFAMSVDGSDASFDLRIPTEIVTEAGGVASLKVPFLVSGPGTGYSPKEAEVTGIVYDASEDNYKGQVSFSGAFNYGTIYAYVKFLKLPGEDLLGTCNFESYINTTQRISLCNIPVTNSLISSGNILGTVGVSVCEADASNDCNALVGGADVYILDASGDSDLFGITGTGAVNNFGYLLGNLTSGTHTLRGYHSDGSGRFGEETITINSLDVVNLDILLTASAPTNPSIVINGGNQYTYSQYVTLTLSAQDELGITDYYASESPIAPGEGDWIPSTMDQNGLITTAFKMSSGTGEKVIYVWFRNIPGHSSEQVQSSIVVQDDTSLRFENFQFTQNIYSTPTDNSGNSYCLTDPSGGSGYRIVDWQDLLTLISHDSSTDTGSFKTGEVVPSEGILKESKGGKRREWRLPAIAHGGFVTFNGNYDFNGEYFAITEPSNSDRDREYGWSPIVNSYITDNAGSLQLFTLRPSDMININTFEWVHLLCYLDNGSHPLLNGDFTDGSDYWDHISGAASFENGALALQTSDVSTDTPRVQQDLITVRANTSYDVNVKLKSTYVGLKLTFGFLGATIEDASYDTFPNDWTTNASSIELSGEGDMVNDYYYLVSMRILTDASNDITIYTELENSGSFGDGAYVDDITITELP